METPLLAAALIVKNEEKFLPDCIASLNELRPLLSEICIYDTGSTDRTVEIARAAGARVEQGYWDDDFARARNAAVAMCNAKWVLNIDADERIRADQAKLRTVLRDGLTSNLVGIDALEIEIRNLDPDGDPVSSFRVRRFLRPGRAEYHGVIHETIGALRDGKLTCWPLASDVLYYDHIGYEHGTMPVKGSRNLELAELDVAHNGDGADVDLQLTALLNRARSFMTLGKWADAVDDYVKIWKVKSDAPRRIWAMQDLAELLVKLGAYDDAAVIARELSADGRYPDIAALLMARARMGQGRHRGGSRAASTRRQSPQCHWILHGDHDDDRGADDRGRELRRARRGCRLLHPAVRLPRRHPWSGPPLVEALGRPVGRRSRRSAGRGRICPCAGHDDRIRVAGCVGRCGTAGAAGKDRFTFGALGSTRSLGRQSIAVLRKAVTGSKRSRLR
ncbi:MAG: glycosyltransferase [Austwickia sp.]|nr:glycosyltransferase [Austwickia sp.]